MSHLTCFFLHKPTSILYIILHNFQSDFNEFLETFTKFLKRSLIHGDKQPAVERTLSFVAKFATTKKELEDKGEKQDECEKEPETEKEAEEEADPFLVQLILFLLHVSIY